MYSSDTQLLKRISDVHVCICLSVYEDSANT
uniref:Uncharacterized protein n=1 Tax=Anguilla anguilla TaxID=7936 RepID=A0A0E9RBB6_ANGAN